MLCFINGCFGMDDYEHGICVMNVLSLFTGAGGGELAFQHLLTGFRTIGYVEIDDYCQRIIRQRQLDGLLDQAPIFGDIRTFIDSGCCELYKGIADIVTAGFPCQPFSVAGKQLAEKDNRNLWPETIKTIRIIRPATVFLENVPGLLASEHALTIFRQLRENGYQTVPPLKLGADAMSEPELKSPAQIDKLIGGKAVSKEYAYKPEGGLSVAHESDSRAAINTDTKSMFTTK